MKRLSGVFSIVLALTAMWTSSVLADGDSRSVTGAGTALFGAGAALGPVALQNIELGTGVFIEADGSASGTFHAVLQGSSLGVPRQITVEGKIRGGATDADGHATFSGTASIDFGDGGPPLSGIAFSVSAGTDSLVVAIDSTTLPAARVTAGAITIE
jgi:hypothetical protein